MLPPVNIHQIAQQRVTNAEIKFNDFQYRSSYAFSPQRHEAVVTETFTSADGTQVRQNEERLYMEPVDAILKLARECGFIVHGQTNLEERGDAHQYIYLLERPH